MVSVEGELARIERIITNLRELRTRVPFLFGYEDISKFSKDFEEAIKDLEETSYRLRQLLKLKEVI